MIGRIVRIALIVTTLTFAFSLVASAQGGMSRKSNSGSSGDTSSTSTRDSGSSGSSSTSSSSTSSGSWGRSSSGSSSGTIFVPSTWPSPERRNRSEPDATPSKKDSDPGNTSQFKRVGERRDGYRERRVYRPIYYPYDPGYIVIIEEPYPAPIPVPIHPEPEPRTVPAPSQPTVPPDAAQPLPPIPHSAYIPTPRTPQAALDQIAQAWMLRDPRLLRPLLSYLVTIKVYKDRELLNTTNSVDFYTRTAEAIQSLTTDDFQLRVVDRIDDRVFARGYHTYRGADNVVRNSKITYTIEFLNGRWVIMETGFTPVTGDRSN